MSAGAADRRRRPVPAEPAGRAGAVRPLPAGRHLPQQTAGRQRPPAQSDRLYLHRRPSMPGQESAGGQRAAGLCPATVRSAGQKKQSDPAGPGRSED